jgi:adenosylcobinamide-GDP ribazoletransferase
MRSFLIALQFLTVLPIRIEQQPDAEATGRSLLYYPLVGLMLGALLAVPAWMLGDAAALMAAALLLSLWVAATGALHLDGLADSADAWIGGFGNRDRTLAIMKDPYCGPAAVTTLVLVLLIKFTALTQIIANGNWEILLVVPVLGRSTLILLFLTTPYVHMGLALLAVAVQQRLGGTTGDTAGALVEITEAAVLVTAALVW